MPRPVRVVAAVAVLAVAVLAAPAGAAPPSREVPATPEAVAAREVASFWLDDNAATIRRAEPHDLSLGPLSTPDPGEGRPGSGVGAVTLPPGPKGLGRVLFTDAAGEARWCTGVAMVSSNRSVVATAGDCVYDMVSNELRDRLVFVPDGQSPMKPVLYVVRQLFTHYDFTVYEDHDRAYAFLVVHEGVRSTGRSLKGTGKLLDQTGGQTLAVGTPTGSIVHVIGHPTGWALEPWALALLRGERFDRTWGPVAIARLKAEELLGVRSSNPLATSIGSIWLTGYDQRSKTGSLAGITLGTGPDAGGVAVHLSPVIDGEARAVLDQAAAAAPSAIA